MFEIAFTHPLYLAGGGLIAAPIIIHLLNKMRFRSVRFAPMEFLFEAEQKNKKRVLLEQLLLLLLRILLVLLVVLLIARPYVGSSLGILLGGKRTHDVVILDDTCSMSDRWGDTSAFQQARKAVLQLAKEAANRPGTHLLTILRLSSPRQPDLLRRAVDATLLNRLELSFDSLECTHGDSSILSGLQEAWRLFEEDEKLNRSLHLISDFRARQWEEAEALVKVLEPLDQQDVSLNFVRCVKEQHQNLTVTDLSIKARNVAVGVPTPFKVTVHNQGPDASEAFELALVLDGQPLPGVKFEAVAAGKKVSNEFEVVFEKSGRHRIQVRLPEDSLAPDNQRSLSLTIDPRIPVIIVSGEGEDQQLDYVAYALAPGGRAQTGIDPVIRTAEALATERLEKFRMVYLVNVPELNPASVNALEKYVRGGGGLVIFMGNLINAAFYNQKLYRKGEGFFLASLISPKNATPPLTPGAPQVTFDLQPIFKPFAGAKNPFIQSVRAYKLFSIGTEWQTDLNIRILARLNTGEPFIMSKNFGDGRVMVFLAGLDPVWTNWPKNPSFVIAMLRVQEQLSKKGFGHSSQKVGEPMRLQFDSHEYRRDLALTLPGREKSDAFRITASPTKDDPAMLQAVFPGTLLSGIYEIILAPIHDAPARRYFAFNVDPAEGDLTLISKQKLSTRLKGIDFRFQDASDPDWFDASSNRQELLNLIVGFLILFLVCEQLLAYRVSYHPKGEIGRLKD